MFKVVYTIHIARKNIQLNSTSMTKTFQWKRNNYIELVVYKLEGELKSAKITNCAQTADLASDLPTAQIH